MRSKSIVLAMILVLLLAALPAATAATPAPPDPLDKVEELVRDLLPDTFSFGTQIHADVR